ncbi:MAG: hypothetical protein ACOCP8_03560 [archaeon]
MWIIIKNKKILEKKETKKDCLDFLKTNNSKKLDIGLYEVEKKISYKDKNIINMKYLIVDLSKEDILEKYNLSHIVNSNMEYIDIFEDYRVFMFFLIATILIVVHIIFTI